MAVGSGTITPVVPSGDVYPWGWCEGAVTLARYADIVGYSQCAFWGISREDNIDYACRAIWTKAQRDAIARKLCEAQDMIENELGYFVEKKWIAAERHDYTLSKLVFEKKNLIAAGIRASTDLILSAPINHATDPTVIGPIAAGTITDKSEIYVFYPGKLQRIVPYSVDISGGWITIEIPRCRLLKSTALDNPIEGLLYADMTNYLTAVDVKRIYNDDTTQATIIGQKCDTTPCTTDSETGCMSIKNYRLAVATVSPADYSAGAWEKACFSFTPEFIDVYYQSGATLSFLMEDAIVRLAHSLMPNEPCGCETVKNVWLRDRNVPRIPTSERTNCEFGLSDGAWAAWNFTQNNKIFGASSWRG